MTLPVLERPAPSAHLASPTTPPTIIPEADTLPVLVHSSTWEDSRTPATPPTSLLPDTAASLLHAKTRPAVLPTMPPTLMSPETVPEFARGNDVSGQYRVIRGGCWYTKDAECLPSLRSPMTPGGRSHYLGFRVVLVKKPAAK